MHFSNKKLIFVLTLSSFLALGPDAYASKTDDSWILNRQGMYKISQGNVEGAIDDFEKACRLDPFNDTALANLACARNNLGVNFAKKQNFAEAIRQFKNAKDQKPEDISNPKSARCVRLTDDMIEIDDKPVQIEPPFLFEDSGINKINGKYYYSYCTNWADRKNFPGADPAAVIGYMVSTTSTS